MSGTLSRALMALAVCSLGDQRRDWAEAMQAEFEVAVEDGRPLAFAVGCVVAAWREMPRHGEGRLALANYAVALGIILPMAAMTLLAALLGFPFVESGRPGAFGFPTGEGVPKLLLNDGSVAVAPSLSLLVLLLAANHLLVAWLLVDQNWTRAADMARLGAAATTTLVIFTTVSAIDPARMLLPVACLITQSLVVWTLARLHDRLRHGIESEAPS